MKQYQVEYPAYIAGCLGKPDCTEDRDFKRDPCLRCKMKFIHRDLSVTYGVGWSSWKRDE